MKDRMFRGDFFAEVFDILATRRRPIAARVEDAIEKVTDHASSVKAELIGQQQTLQAVLSGAAESLMEIQQRLSHIEVVLQSMPEVVQSNFERYMNGTAVEVIAVYEKEHHPDRKKNEIAREERT
jgi:predicted  nucleic acid-binding Zn-ribbon protein